VAFGQTLRDSGDLKLIAEAGLDPFPCAEHLSTIAATFPCFQGEVIPYFPTFGRLAFQLC